jgi:hypothetical protein
MTTSDIHYQKRKNAELFQSLEDTNKLYFSKLQNYIPIYKRFFDLNSSNYNSINLNHKWYISNVFDNEKDSKNIYNCRIKNVNTNKNKDTKVFFKFAPLLDPYKYLTGKYDIHNEHLFDLPKMEGSDKTHRKILDYNNSAYVDGFFTFLNNTLIFQHNFIHGVNYYGSFIGIKNNYVMNVYDDLEHLTNSDFFNKHKNILFTMDEYNNTIMDDTVTKLAPIKIEHKTSVSNLSIQSLNNEMFDNVFDETSTNQSISNELHDVTTIINNNMTADKYLTLKSNSTCSSRFSYTSDSNNGDENEDESDDSNEDNEDDADDSNEDDDNEDNEDNDNEDNSDSAEEEEEEDDNSEDYETDSDCDSYTSEEEINVTIKQFPIQLICMENCTSTLDNLILSEELSIDEWTSVLMQVIMILITYQKVYSFTHNDLHTNNIMYNETTQKYIYYCYNSTYYKVPTFGRIFKIIDFGRSIYKFNGMLFCSDSFKNGEDAASQYNFEPYFNDKKPRLEPNYSFDLCRLACSIFDYLIEDITQMNVSMLNPIQKIIYEWCLDDKGINVLYKNDGSDRYPDFKLYKMIARFVHNHTPNKQLIRPEFKQYVVKTIASNNECINIDKMQVLA